MMALPDVMRDEGNSNEQAGFLQCEGTGRTQARQDAHGRRGRDARRREPSRGPFAPACALGCDTLRDRAYGRWLSALVALALVLLSPISAYADATPVLDVNGAYVNGTDSGYVVCNVGNGYDAALAAIGLWNTKIQINNDMYARLSNESTGGDFWQLANAFRSQGTTGSFTYLPWYGPQDYQLLNIGMYGDNRVWYAIVPKSLISSAKRDYNVILSGGSLGGGSGGSTDGDYLEFSGGIYYAQKSSSSYGGFYAKKDGDGNQTPRYYYSASKVNLENDDNLKVAPNITVLVSKSAVEGFLKSYPEQSYNYSCIISTSNSFGVVHTVLVAIPINETMTVSTATNDFYGTNDYYSQFVCSGEWHSRSYSSGVNYYTYSDGVLTVTDLMQPQNASNSGGQDGNTWSVGVNQRLFVSGGGTVILPPNNWPDTPQNPTPEPPEVPTPEPPTPTVDPTPPIDPTPPQNPIIPTTPIPDPPTPITPIVVSEPTNTSPTDYTPWLRAILQQLRNIATSLGDGFNMIGAALDDHCIHLQNALGSWMQWLERSIAVIVNNARLSLQSYLKYLFDTIDAHITNKIDAAIYDLELYMKQQMEWLAHQLQFDVSGGGYDDSTVVSWLKKIYLWLIGKNWSNPVGNPTQPQVDTSISWWERLLQLIADTIGGFVGGFVEGVSGLVNSLRTKFPFSVPWDIAAFLALLVSERQTPVFDLTIPAIGGWWGDVAVRVDLTPYDGLAATCRTMVLLVWCCCLILKTQWLGEVMDYAAGSFGGFMGRLVGSHA